MSYAPELAATYDQDVEHRLPPGEASAWLHELSAVAGSRGLSGDLLDVGAGTGALTAVMKQVGFRVVGLEPSLPMIREGLAQHSVLRSGDFVVGDAGEENLFGPARFDWIVSRQVLCYLAEPGSAFASWHGWLRPDGHVLVVDGLWPQTTWSEHELKRAPLAALSDALPVVDAFVGAGFTVIRSGPFLEVDEARLALWPATTPRYLVLARKT